MVIIPYNWIGRTLLGNLGRALKSNFVALPQQQQQQQQQQRPNRTLLLGSYSRGQSSLQVPSCRETDCTSIGNNPNSHRLASSGRSCSSSGLVLRAILAGDVVFELILG